MLSNLKKAAISAMVGLGIIAAAPVTAQAAGIKFNGGNASIGIWFGDSGHSHWRPRHHRPRFNGCTVKRALNKAARMGVRHPRVRAVNHRVIKVSGRARHHYVRITFARSPGCPVIRY